MAKNIYKVTQEQYDKIIAGTLPGYTYDSTAEYIIIDNIPTDQATLIRGVTSVREMLYRITQDYTTQNGRYYSSFYDNEVIVVYEYNSTQDSAVATSMDNNAIISWNYSNNTWYQNVVEEGDKQVTVIDALTNAYYDDALKFIKGGDKNNIISVTLPFIGQDKLSLINQSFKSASVDGNELVFTKNDNSTQRVQLPINTDDDGSSDLNAIDLGTSNIEDALNKIVSEYRSTNGFYVTGDDLQGGYTKALINYWSETTADAACIVYRADDIQYWSWGGEDWVCSYGLRSIHQTKLAANGFKTDVGQQGEAVLLGPGNKEVMMAGQGISVGNTQTDLFLYGKTLTYNNNNLVTEDQLDGKLDANGLQTATEDDAIQLLSSDGRVITQINETDNWMDVGNMDTSLYLYGKRDRPFYNDNDQLALKSDIITVKITDLRK